MRLPGESRFSTFTFLINFIEINLIFFITAAHLDKINDTAISNNKYTTWDHEILVLNLEFYRNILGKDIN